MPPLHNPLKLNPLQLKTLTLLQILAASPAHSQPEPGSGRPFITLFPQPHGHHFHIGSWVVASADATGLQNEGVWKALHRKGLAENRHPFGILLTEAGMGYDTGSARHILHSSDH